MPQYEYSCDACGNTATKLRKMDDRDEPITCGAATDGDSDICGSTMIRVVALPGNPQFRGPGFTPKFYR